MRVVVVAAAAALSLIAGVASAADRVAEPRKLRATAECVVSEEPVLVRNLLRTLPGSRAETEAANRLVKVYSACSGGEFSLALSKGTQGLYNGRSDLAAAAAASALSKGGADAARLSGVQLWYQTAISGRTQGADYDAIALGMQEFGTCVLNAAPAASGRLVASAAGSAAENQGLDAIKPVLAGCVVAGKPISIKRDQLRLMIAEPLYHAIVDGPTAGRRS